ncbi:GCN5-related N-acetyltransferase 3, chloroplastic [Lolium perenne]|uniref:GCN5-related N-acetyltransferase 3, chloroplastic n=1 Tax=Lolium perenne TaxID=4522 RepID=UPI0021F62073|nr:serotonin N-acetyltransferase 2, chloroplastic [Lolium perenne]
MAAGVSRLPPRLTTLAVYSSSPTPNPFSPNNRRVARARPRLPPISISMDPALADPAHVQALMLACAHSCAIRLSAPPAGPEPVDIRKLRTALAHSFLVVSVFCGARFLELEDGDGADERRFLGLDLDLDLGFGRRGEQRLVGFGRAVSDVGLTASVHDVVVHPSLQRRGIGRKILEKITRVLHSRGIYDISVLCTGKERPFFESCGFDNDAMGSTTMMYTKSIQK